ncbi:MAG: peroxidase [Acidobacteriota bacterium]|nr:peroxidase [Acidobacteriota bacterium]
MKPMYLPDVERSTDAAVQAMQNAGAAVPQILHLFAYKPELTAHLSAFSQAVMRGPSPLSAGFRELIAAFTSKLNQCPF